MAARKASHHDTMARLHKTLETMIPDKAERDQLSSKLKILHKQGKDVVRNSVSEIKMYLRAHKWNAETRRRFHKIKRFMKTHMKPAKPYHVTRATMMKQLQKKLSST
ncbi:PREDICTED: uncharacterized protein LOC106820477 [Priapulus caudatus]|uniref:Uncharacterized protein LOC106820477 n=1 Tax=Priapulus caudatus TaxID=37621 RepID=A0ABM1F7Q5_PRICU|nr:PREDICTED: uncharacterized protein LOC106820477 [Priapulus caudatus]